METVGFFSLDINCYNLTTAENMPIPSASIFYIPSNPFGVWLIIVAFYLQYITYTGGSTVGKAGSLGHACF
jgi:hypothetical protein